MLTAEVPYPRDADEAKLWAHLTEPAPSACEQVPDVPPQLDAVIARAMSKLPDDRYPSAGDVARAAAAALHNRPVEEPERRVAAGGAAPLDGSTVSGARPRVDDEQATQRLRGRPRRGVVATAGAGAAALVAVGLVLALSGKDESDPPPPPPDPTPTPVATLVDTIPVAQRPNAIAATARDVWVASSRSESLTRVNARRNRVTDARLVVGVGARDVDVRDGSLWIVNSLRRELTRADARSGKRRGEPLAFPRAPVTVDAAGETVWVGAVPSAGSPEASVVYKVDRRRMAVRTHSASRRDPQPRQRPGRGVGRGWSDPVPAPDEHGQGESCVARRPRSDRNRRRGRRWVASRRADHVLQVEIPSGRIVTIPVRGAPSHVAIADGVVWVSNYGGHTLTRIDPRSSKVVGTVSVGRNPFALAARDHTLWVTVVADNSISRLRY